MKPFKVNVAFDNLRAGQILELDPDVSRVKGLVGAGYLIPQYAIEVEDDRDDNGSDDDVPGDDVVVPAAPKRKRRLADGGQGKDSGTDQSAAEADHSGPAD